MGNEPVIAIAEASASANPVPVRDDERIAALDVLRGVALLGILAMTGTNPDVLTLVGLLVLGATVLLTGSTLSGTVMGFMEPTVTATTRTGSWSQSHTPSGAAE